MTRPTLPPPVWATDETNNTEPSLAQKQSGWTPGQDGVSDYDNWWKREALRHIQWLYEQVGAGTRIYFPQNVGRPGNSTKPWEVWDTGVRGIDLQWSFMIDLQPGAVIREVRGWLGDTGPAPKVATFGIIEWDIPTFGFTSIASASTSGSGARQLLTLAGLDYEVPAGPDTATSIGMSPFVTTTTDYFYFYRVEVDYDFDAP